MTGKIIPPQFSRPSLSKLFSFLSASILPSLASPQFSNVSLSNIQTLAEQVLQFLFSRLESKLPVFSTLNFDSRFDYKLGHHYTFSFAVSLSD